MPRIVKNPNLSRRLGELLDAGAVEIEHVIIPIRVLDVAAASRVRNTGYGSDLHTFGGLFGTSPGDAPARGARARVLRADVHGRALRPAAHAPALPALRRRTGSTPTRSSRSSTRASSPSGGRGDRGPGGPPLMHEEPLTRAERAKTFAGTFYNRGIARPLRGVRRRSGRDSKRPDAGPRATTSSCTWRSLNTAPRPSCASGRCATTPGHDFDLVVGDGGSTDGTLAMLRDFERRGWLTLDVAPGGRKHWEWLDLWVRDLPGPLRRVLRLRRRVPAARAGSPTGRRGVATRSRAHVRGDAVAAAPSSGTPPPARPRRSARPRPWLFLLDLEQVRGRVDDELPLPRGGGSRRVRRQGRVRRRRGVLRGAAAAGLAWTEMPEAFRRSSATSAGSPG